MQPRSACGKMLKSVSRIRGTIACRSTVPARLRVISMTARSFASGCTSSTPKPPVFSDDSTIVTVSSPVISTLMV